MSGKATGWMWEMIVRDNTLTDKQRLVLLRFADFANSDGEEARPSYATVAKSCHCSTRTVQDAVRRGMELGLIRCSAARRYHYPAVFAVPRPEAITSGLKAAHSVHPLPVRPEASRTPDRKLNRADLPKVGLKSQGAAHNGIERKKVSTKYSGFLLEDSEETGSSLNPSVPGAATVSRPLDAMSPPATVDVVAVAPPAPPVKTAFQVAVDDASLGGTPPADSSVALVILTAMMNKSVTSLERQLAAEEDPRQRLRLQERLEPRRLRSRLDLAARRKWGPQVATAPWYGTLFEQVVTEFFAKRDGGDDGRWR